MPQIDFFAGNEDEATLVRMFLDMGFHIVPDLGYDTEEPKHIRTWDTYQEICTQTTLFFLLHDDCQRSPLVTYRIEGSGFQAGKYAIHQRQGGPALSFLCYRPYDDRGVICLPAGFLGCYPTYKNTKTERFEKTPLLMRRKYNEIANRIRMQARLVEFETLDGGWRKYWILPGAQDALHCGAKLGVVVVEELGIRGLEDLPNAISKPPIHQA